MNTPPPSTNFTGRLLKRTGGFYIVSVLVISQLITIPIGITLAALLFGINSELTIAQITRLAIVTALLMVIRNAFLLIYAHTSNRAVISRLRKWVKHEPFESGGKEESLAWKQITSLPWRYVGIAFPTLMLVVLPLSAAYLFFVLKGNTDQIYYLIFAGTASGLANEIFEVLFVESVLTNARLILTPHGFEAQTAGVRGIRLLIKFLAAFFALILVTILAIAPIGYHQTVTVLYKEVGSLNVLANLQIQSIIVGIFSLLIGFGIAIFITNSISQPVRQMIKTFRQIEDGDLKQRVPITATDEVGELAVHFNHMISSLEELQTGLEKRVTDRTGQLNATIEVGRVASSILDSDELIAKVVNLITDRFSYYYAAIFLTDSSNRWAELKDATGTVGQTLKAQGHRLELGGKSMVSTAITTRQARIAENVGSELVRFDNPLLPGTKSEIALPLIVGERTIGALDVQSTQEAAFGSEEIDTLQGMANQVAIALENAHLFQETQESLEELRTTQRLYVADAWSETAREQGGYDYIARAETSEPGGETSTVNVPLTLRDQVIGQLQLEGRQDWTPEERNLIEAVATQASLALENARLLEESQQLALRERLASEIIGKIWSSTNEDIILQTAVKELGRALRADEATIELKAGETK
jgi:GAF domain-containing protein/HAMP domain-containing protein